MRRLGLADQRPFGHQRLPDATRDGCGDGGEVEVNTGRLLGCPGGCHIGLGLLLCGDQGGVLLLADSIGFHQWFVTLHLCGRLCHIGLRLQHARLCTVQRRLVDRWIDLVKHLAGLDLTALAEHALQHDTIDPGPHLGDPHRTDASGQFGLQGHRSRLDGYYADFGRWHRSWTTGSRRSVFAATRCQCHGQGDEAQAGKVSGYRVAVG